MPLAMPTLALTDSQVDAIERAAAPLPRGVRDAFRAALAQRLSAYSEIGDGIVYRVIVETQKLFFDAPSLDEQPRRRMARPHGV
jgi:hypothetical protein